ncbi:biotin/lipoyl-containing protein [Deferrisoma sp.]
MIEVRAPMAGNVWKVECAPGDAVAANDPVVVLEVMKMEADVFAPASGVVKEVRVKPGDAVEEDQVLVVLEPA